MPRTGSIDQLARWVLALAITAAAALFHPSQALAGGALLAAGASGPAWHELSPAQREALRPLQRDWNQLDTPRKQKWLEVAGRFPRMSAAEQERVQARMGDWARLTPIERGRVRQNFQEAKQVAPEERQARWRAYQALSEEERKELAEQAAARRARIDAANPATREGRRAPRPSAEAEAGQSKSNVVPNPLHSAGRPKPVAPTVLQASPGATTTLMSRRPTPPVHQQPGLPKIAATPGFVDSQTLLPKRGPQGAAVEPVRPAKPRKD